MTLAHRLRSLLLLAAPAALGAALLVAPPRAIADQPDEKAPAAKPADAKPAESDANASGNDTDAKAAAGAKGDSGAKADAGADGKPDAPPAPKVATVTPEAKKVIEQVDAAYGKLKTLELAGTFSGDINAAGEERKEVKKFTASFSAPNKFRHSMEEDILIGSTGDKAYAYLQGRNLYAQAEAPKEKSELEKLPEPIPQVIQMQNPSLMLAVVRSAASQLSETFADIKKTDDVQLDGAAFQALQLTLPNKIIVTMLFHPDTHLLRQTRSDIKPMLEQRGTPDVKQAVLTVDYTTVKPDASVKDEQFAWAPPQTARDIAEVKQADAAAPGGDDSPATALEGKAAPEFKLKGMDGKEVALSGLKGKVVVLDMWATWCPPCRASLPHLDKLYQSVKDKGVNVYAVNLQEEPDEVAAFVKKTNLTVPVLLDKDGAVAQSYKASAIPQTVVIGKDGKVAKVFIGFGGEETAREMKDAVEKAMK
jgi:peroxiredoxin